MCMHVLFFQEKLRVAVLVSKAALQFIHGNLVISLII